MLSKSLLANISVFFIWLMKGHAVKLSGSTKYAILNTTYTLTCNGTGEGLAIAVFSRNHGTVFGTLSYNDGQCNNLLTNPITACLPDVCSCNGKGVFNWTIPTVTNDWHRSNVTCYSFFGGLNSNVMEIFVAVPFSSAVIAPDHEVELEEGSFVEFTCLTHPASRPAANVSWFVVEDDNKTLISTNVSMLNRTSVADDVLDTQSMFMYYPDRLPSRKKVFCVASAEGLGSVSSTNVTVNVIYQPTGSLKISSLPEGPLYSDGSNVTLTCTLIGGNPIANLTWNCNTENSSLNIRDISSNDEAVLQLNLIIRSREKPTYCNCTAFHSVEFFMQSTRKTFNFFVIPSEKPKVTTNPEGLTYIDGTDVTLICRVEGGKPLASLSWKCKGEAVKEHVTSTNISNTVESRLNLKMDPSFDNESCFCLASHDDPSYKEEIQVNFTVFYTSKDSLLITLNPVNVIEGDNVTIVCSLFGGSPVANVQIICGQLSGDNTNTNNGATSTIRIFNVKQKSNETTCLCEATHKKIPNFRRYLQYHIPVSKTVEKETSTNTVVVLKEEESNTSTILAIVLGLLATGFIVLVTIATIYVMRRRNVTCLGKRDNPSIGGNQQEDGYSTVGPPASDNERSLEHLTENRSSNKSKSNVYSYATKAEVGQEHSTLGGSKSDEPYSCVRTDSIVQRNMQNALKKKELKSNDKADTEFDDGNENATAFGNQAYDASSSLPVPNLDNVNTDDANSKGYIYMGPVNKEKTDTQARNDLMSNVENDSSNMPGDDGYITADGKDLDQSKDPESPNRDASVTKM